MRACALLPAVTGNLGQPGTGFLYLNGASRAGSTTPTSAARPPAPTAAAARQPHGPRRPPRGSRRSRALVCWNINIAASSPEQARLRAALAREDLFTVAIDLFPTDTTDFADVVLPAASFLEFDDLVAPTSTVRSPPRSRRPSRSARPCPTRRSSGGSRRRWASSRRPVVSPRTST